ncbi:endonuclease/exonuclease/phosphatase family protein [Gaetbulibacter aestuarii]|uniref:Endonuclease/exonuclease/phosphatase family protein n=1 Tax=Gaetbulibacter aestuarii TaxID=1502358 RepID=A0ABW7MVN4_9FLAO
MNLRQTAIFWLFLSVLATAHAQGKRYNIRTVAFYNLENLFDTINNPNKLDEYSPIMEMKSNRSEAYWKKIHNMARVLSDIGKDESQDSPAIIGVSEVENKAVVQDLVNDSLLIEKNYGIIQYPSPDLRGIDVALLYQKRYFTPTSSKSYELKIYDNTSGKRQFTRDQLVVSGQLEGEPVHFIVNHWPSRRGGEKLSGYKRLAAAKLTKRITDSLLTLDPYAKVVIMGDLNDDPTSNSLKKGLKSSRKRTRMGLGDIYNPFENFYHSGLGTTAFRDAWSLFDQLLMTRGLLNGNYNGFQFYKAGIYNKNVIVTASGRYKGYPLRSWGNGGFTNGFSDHFPVYIYLIKKIETDSP